MRHSIIYLIIVPIVLIACTKGNDIQNANIESDKSITWVVGAEHSNDTTVNIRHTEGPIQISLDNYSICPNHELLITLSTDDEVIYSQRVKDPNEIITLTPPAGRMIHIKTNLVLADNLIYCIWLGQTTIRYDYKE